MKANTISVGIEERNKGKISYDSFYERRKDPTEVLMDDDYDASIKNIKN